MDPSKREQIDKLKEKWAAVRTGADDIQRAADTDSRDLSEDEANRFRGLMDEHAKIGAEIERREQLLEAEMLEQKSTRKTTTKATDTSPTPFRTPEIEVLPRYGKLRGFRGPHAEERAMRAGKWVQAMIYGNLDARNWCMDRGMDMRAHGESVLSKGGIFVPDELEQAIIDLREEYGVARQFCKVQPMAGDHMIIPRRTGGLTAYALGEGDAHTESTKSWDGVELTAKKWGVLAKYSSELAEDAIISIAEDLAKEAAYAFAAKEDACLFNGDGTATYNGIRGILIKLFDTATYAGGVYTAAAGNDQFVEYTAGDLGGMMAKCPKYALKNAKFYCSQVAFSLVFERLAAAYAGNAIRDVEGGLSGSYMGYPIVISQSMPTSTADLSGEIVMLFGDLSLAATLGDRRGTRIQILNELYAATDQIGLVATTRSDINVHDIGSATVSGPIIGLEAET